jgi:hypothetical protein
VRLSWLAEGLCEGDLETPLVAVEVGDAVTKTISRTVDRCSRETLHIVKITCADFPGSTVSFIVVGSFRNV